MKQNLEQKLVVRDVIAGHVVPNKLLFTDPLDRLEHKTATYTDKATTDDIKVTAVLQQTSEGCNYITCIHLDRSSNDSL